MTIAEQITRAKADLDEVYAAGKQAEYDAFWDAYQSNGERASYENAFSGRGWNDITFFKRHLERKSLPSESKWDELLMVG